MKTIENLPVYDIVVSDDESSDVEMNFIALVDRPAIQKNFLAFNENKRLVFFDDERRIISGAFMLADTPIYRRNPQTKEEYYTVFRKETIYTMVQKFFKKGFQSNVNEMHDDRKILDGVVVFESFITDNARGIKPMTGFEDVPEGSWFGSMYVENEKTWQDVKDGKFLGFSIEGLFGLQLTNKPTREALSEEEKILAQLRELLK
jgi:hypothetical protein